LPDGASALPLLRGVGWVNKNFLGLFFKRKKMHFRLWRFLNKMIAIYVGEYNDSRHAPAKSTIYPKPDWPEVNRM
jgi:hypothetical protein